MNITYIFLLILLSLHYYETDLKSKKNELFFPFS